MSKKPLIVYYSLTGNTKLVAEAIQEATGAEILELKPEKELNPNSSSKFMWGGAQVYMKKKPKLKSIDINPLDYDLIFLGTPVWAWSFSPPIRTFLHKFDLKGKDVAIWTSAGGDTEKAIERFKEELEKNDAKVVGKILFKEPKTNNPDEAKQKAMEWAKEIINA